ncbi:zinc finger BED domain-containing protein RICESLEEPER 2-like [Tasmannia lanceolata]|uniref:zinc finger BED domain-containing protein RICESLEEPER 2-like n=1 Tax=Tasmannia lanceolata TaxID=3420 RepID=UPI0040642A10
MNKLIFIAVIVDPRHKLDFVRFALIDMYREEKGNELVEKVFNATLEMFNEFTSKLTTNTLQQVNLGESSSKLDRYLSEDAEEDISEDFDISGWWKLNSPRFPILSQMAQSVLAVPISTVSSESTFNTGGHVLDTFRSSLTPKIVQALICDQDWLR